MGARGSSQAKIGGVYMLEVCSELDCESWLWLSCNKLGLAPKNMCRIFGQLFVFGVAQNLKDPQPSSMQGLALVWG